jgi:hypothetical protein
MRRGQQSQQLQRDHTTIYIKTIDEEMAWSSDVLARRRFERAPSLSSLGQGTRAVVLINEMLTKPTTYTYADGNRETAVLELAAVSSSTRAEPQRASDLGECAEMYPCPSRARMAKDHV